MLQLRAKQLSDRQVVTLAHSIKKPAKKNRVKIILNDRADLALAADVDGVHLGQEDLPVKVARKILGRNKIIGVSAHNPAQAKKAQQQGADYIGVGPIFTTATKPKTAAVATQMISKIQARVSLPCVAIGGITLSNLKQVLAAGAQAVAVCRAITLSGNPAGATRIFRQRLYQ